MRSLRVILAIGVIFWLASCSFSETTMHGLWKDMSYEGGQYNKVAVVGVAENETARKLFEDELAGQLKKGGLKAIASHTIVSNVKKGDKEALAKKFEEMGIDVVLVTKIFGKDEAVTYMPSTIYSFGEYHESGYSESGAMWSSAYYLKDDLVTLETNIFDVSSRKLIWSALTQTFIMSDVETRGEVIEGFGKFLIKELKKESYF